MVAKKVGVWSLFDSWNKSRRSRWQGRRWRYRFVILYYAVLIYSGNRGDLFDKKNINIFKKRKKVFEIYVTLL